MKKILYLSALVSIMVLAFTQSTNATVHFRYKVQLTDGCSPTGYTGNYVMSCTVKLGSTTLCTNNWTGLTYEQLVKSAFTCDYTCDIPDQQVNCTYELDITICRETSPLTCCAITPITGVCWWYLDGSQGIYTFAASI
jgi:hypothetical protein